MAKMKILHTVQGYLPERNGMQEVVSQLSEKLVALGHEVTVATTFSSQRTTAFINGVKVVSFNISGNAVTGMSGETDSYISFLKQSDFDIITNFAAQQWATDLMLPVLKEIKAKKVFVPTGFSALNVPAYKSYFENMKSWMKEYDANIFLSDNYRDINFARANNVQQVGIIPNGASETEFANAPFIDIRKLIHVPEDSPLIITVGNHTGYKGHAEAMKIFSEAAIPNASLLVIGNDVTNGNRVFNKMKEVINLAGLKDTNCSLSCKLTAARYNALSPAGSIRVQAMSRTETINTFKQADLFLFPSLIECSPIVLFESLAAGTPFLVADVGNAKEIIEWTGGGQLLPTVIDKRGYSKVNIKESAQMMKTLLNSKPAMESLAKAGNEAVLEKFTWTKIVKQYEGLYLQLFI